MGLLEIWSDIHRGDGHKRIPNINFSGNNCSEFTFQNFAHPGKTVDHGLVLMRGVGPRDCSELLRDFLERVTLDDILRKVFNEIAKLYAAL